MFRVLIRWMVLVTGVFGGVVGLIRSRPYDSQGLAAMLYVPTNCVAPCWQGIRPGTTSADDALAQINQVAAVRDLGSQLDTHPGQIFWHWHEDHPGLLLDSARWAYIWLEENVVSSVFLPDFRRFADLYLWLGRPDQVTIFSDSTFAFWAGGVYVDLPQPDVRLQLHQLSIGNG